MMLQAYKRAIGVHLPGRKPKRVTYINIHVIWWAQDFHGCSFVFYVYIYIYIYIYIYNINYSTKETHIWLPWHTISILGIATHITWYQTVPRSIWNRMMTTINVSRNYPRYQSRTSTGGVSCQKWQFLYFYGHHQKQFLCTHDLTRILDQYHWTMKCFPLRKSLMRNMWHRTRWFTMTLVSTDQGTTRVVG